MGPWSTRQLAAVGAVAATVLFVIGFLLPGSPPAFDAGTSEVVNHFHENHKKVLAATVLVEIGVALLAALVAQLAVLLRDAGQRAEAAVVGIAGAASLATFAVGIGLWGGLAQLVMFGDEAGAVGPFYRLIAFMLVGWFWLTFVVVATVALAAWNGTFPRWVAAANGVIAVLLVLGGISVKGHGALAAGTGALCQIATFAFLVWVLHLAVVFWPKAQPAATPGATPV